MICGYYIKHSGPLSEVKVLTDKKISLLHYWLTNMRGGEMVFAEICKMFPTADIFTHAAIPEKLTADIASHKFNESFIAKLPWGRKQCQKYLPLMPAALKKWDFSGCDLIISSESGPIKGIRKPANCHHICYCHTPMRYLWDMYEDYYDSVGVAGKILMSLCKNYLRKYDLKSAECVDQFIANSKFVASRIKRIYNRDAVVIYPPVDINFFSNAPKIERKHYLYVGALVCYKRPDLVVKTFRKLQNEKLIVVGDGGLYHHLRKIATPNIEFINSPSREQIRELYASAKALIFPGIEDFGIVPVEAQAAGCPVIAMNIGGTAETVIDKVTGIHISQQTQENILHAIEELSAIAISDIVMLENAKKFSQDQFVNKFSHIVNQQL